MWPYVAAAQGWHHHHGPPSQKCSNCPTHAVSIDHPDGRILWDTGVPRDWETRWESTRFQDFFPVREDPAGPGYLDSALAELDLLPEDIDIVVLSHLHFDHAANARMFDNGRTRIIVNDKEIAGVAGIVDDFAGAHLVSDFAGLDLESISGDTEILPGISVIETPGHTWGTMSLKVALPEDGTKILTSDAVYLGASWGPSAVGAGIVWDSIAWLESVDKLRRISEASGAEVIFGHDAKQLETLRFSPRHYYS